MRILLVLLALTGAIFLVGQRSESTSAHHDDNGHAGYLFLPSYEQNSRTAAGQSIPITPGFLPVAFLFPYLDARDAWISAMSSIAGFDVFVEGTGGVTMNAGTDVNQCGLLSGGSAAHGCVLAGFDYQAPSGPIYMFMGTTQYPISWDYDHKRSDEMHEMGHVLYLAGEHYPGTYNCVSIMGHCNSPRITDVQDHDKDDFRAAYRMMDAPDAAYGQLTSSTKLKHSFEGGYFGGNGNTIHAEKTYWLDRATTVNGSYQPYKSVARIINNNDDTTPNDVTYSELPSANNEWCMKTRGEAGAIADLGLTYHWGPYSRAYCVARSGAGSGVFVASNRNDYVLFRIWNYSGSQINNVALLLDDGSLTHICDFQSIAPNASPYCVWYPGNSSGRLALWYNWTKNDTIGYDAR